MVLADASRVRPHTTHFRLALLGYLLLALSSSLGLLGKLQLVERIIPVPYRVVAFGVMTWMAFPLFWSFALRARRIVAPLVMLGITVACLVIYPRMEGLRKIGRGSDQPDCVIVAAKGFAAAEWPYDSSKMWTHDPMSCGPGWVLLQTPITVRFGYRWNLVALWALAFALLTTQLSYKAVAGIFTLLGLPVVTWVAVSDGTDFLPYGIILAALFVMAQSSSRLSLLYLLFLTLVVQFRFPMLILPVLFFPRKHLSQATAVSFFAFACQLVLLAWRPEAYISNGPLHLFYKLTKTHLLALDRGTVVMEISLIFAGMLGISMLIRRFTSNPWIAFAYLLALTLIPALVDLRVKYHEVNSLLPALGIWEGANWISACLPLSAILLLSANGDVRFDASPALK